MRSSTISIRLDPALKKKAVCKAKKRGLTFSDVTKHLLHAYVDGKLNIGVVEAEPPHCQVQINVPNRREADTIMRVLLEQKLIAGGVIMNGPSSFHWKGAIEHQTYFVIQAFSLVKHKQHIINATRKHHSDECPVIAFVPVMDGNADFLRWIEQSVRE